MAEKIFNAGVFARYSNEQNKKFASNSLLIDQAQGLARNLSYNDNKEAPIKHTLHELCHRLGNKTVKVVEHKGKLTLLSVYGRMRELTKVEIILYKLFDILPSFDHNV